MSKATQTDDADAVVEHFRALPFDQQVSALRQMQAAIEEGASRRRKELLDQLAELDELTGQPTPALDSKQAGGGRTGKPVPPKYRSKVSPEETWSGRGNEPKWLVAEMKDYNQPKEAFLIRD